MQQATRAVVVGGGPAGLMAAEVLANGGAGVDLYDRMPSVGRKFLLAGKGGLNLTHGEAFEPFVSRYAGRRAEMAALLTQFTPLHLREWARSLGVETFVGSSRRVFPHEMKAAPLLRAWLQRLRGRSVRLHMRHRWLGWADGHDAVHSLRFGGPHGERSVLADVVVLALGGASWPRLGSDGGWVGALREAGAAVVALRPSNCGFEVAGRDGTGWSRHFAGRFAGHALKSVAIAMELDDGTVWQRQGEFVVSRYGVEGSLVYAASAALREHSDAHGSADVRLDLLPVHGLAQVQAELAHPRGSRSLSTHLKSRLGLQGVKAGLLYELLPREALADISRPAQAIKALPLQLVAARPLEEAISSAGGVRFESLDGTLMLNSRPGVFCAGEMLDWEAPTGGYLLNGCLASGLVAGHGALRWLARRQPTP